MATHPTQSNIQYEPRPSTLLSNTRNRDYDPDEDDHDSKYPTLWCGVCFRS
jgi:hypothetical protein